MSHMTNGSHIDGCLATDLLFVGKGQGKYLCESNERNIWKAMNTYYFRGKSSELGNIQGFKILCFQMRLLWFFHIDEIILLWQVLVAMKNTVDFAPKEEKKGASLCFSLHPKMKASLALATVAQQRKMWGTNLIYSDVDSMSSRGSLFYLSYPLPSPIPPFL